MWVDFQFSHQNYYDTSSDEELNLNLYANPKPLQTTRKLTDSKKRASNILLTTHI
jgi:hypothetical protein